MNPEQRAIVSFQLKTGGGSQDPERSKRSAKFRAKGLDDSLKEVSAVTQALGNLKAITDRNWLVIGADSLKDYKVLSDAIDNMSLILMDKRNKLSEKTIDTLLDLYLQNEPKHSVDIELEKDNALLRAEFLKEYKTFTAADIHENSTRTKSRNLFEPASRWKREGRIFAIKYHGKDRFPVFQFEDGEPLPIIKSLLEILTRQLSSWQIAFWFTSGNGWLDGQAPVTCLKDKEAVLYAAKNAASEVVG